MRRIMIFGDSMTYGFDPRGYFGGRYPEPVRWTSRLSQIMTGQWEILSDAANGREIPGSPKEIDYAKSVMTKALPLDMVAVLLGTNDYLNMYEPDIVEVVGRMKKFLEALRDTEELKAAGTALMLIAPPYIHTKEDSFYAKYDTTNGLFSKAYKALAEHMGIWFVDASQWNLEPSFDHIHLSEEGNIRFADRMEETLNNVAMHLDLELRDS